MFHLSSMQWDYNDRLIEADLTGGGMAYYRYDSGGNRVRKIVIKDNVKKERLYLGELEIYKKGSSGTVDLIRESIFVTDDRKRFLQIDSLTKENGIGIDDVNVVNEWRYQYDNHLNSACLELDANGDVISYEEYFPFGGSSYRSGKSEAEVKRKRFRYTGKERDEETGLYNYGARYYAPWLCRFISCDPLGMVDAPSLYAYVRNNPIKLTDPDGMQAGGEDEEEKAHQITEEGDLEGNDPEGNKLKFGQGTLDLIATKDGKVYGYSVKGGGDYLWTGFKFTEVTKGAIKNLAGTEEGRGFLGMLTKLDNFLSQGGNMMFGEEKTNQFSPGRTIPIQNESPAIDVNDLIEVFSLAGENRGIEGDREDIAKKIKFLLELTEHYKGENRDLHPEDARIINDFEGVLRNFAKDNSIDIMPDRIIDSVNIEFTKKKDRYTRLYGFGKFAVEDTLNDRIDVLKVKAIKYKNDTTWTLWFGK